VGEGGEGMGPWDARKGCPLSAGEGPGEGLSTCTDFFTICNILVLYFRLSA